MTFFLRKRKRTNSVKSGIKGPNLWPQSEQSLFNSTTVCSSFRPHDGIGRVDVIKFTYWVWRWADVRVWVCVQKCMCRYVCSCADGCTMHFFLFLHIYIFFLNKNNEKEEKRLKIWQKKKIELFCTLCWFGMSQTLIIVSTVSIYCCNLFISLFFYLLKTTGSCRQQWSV